MSSYLSVAKKILEQCKASGPRAVFKDKNYKVYSVPEEGRRFPKVMIDCKTDFVGIYNANCETQWLVDDLENFRPQPKFGEA